MKKYIAPFLALLAVVSITLLYENNRKYRAESETNKKYTDSLILENNAKKFQLDRYEYIMDRVDEEFSNDCKDKLDSILSETE